MPVRLCKGTVWGWSVLAFCMLSAVWGMPSEASASDGERIVREVVLMRHGVRAPTQSAKTLRQWSTHAWPVWPVQRGQLTPRGAELVTGFWRHWQPVLARHGVLPAAGCPAAKDIWVHADLDQRTRATAQAVLDGVAPGCGLAFSVTTQAVDPLFNPVKAGLSRYDPQALAQEISQERLERLQVALEEPLRLLQAMSGGPSPALCREQGVPAPCAFADMPTRLHVGQAGDSVRIEGGAGIGSSLAEIFLLEYAQWPEKTAAWGTGNTQAIQAILPAHSATFSTLNRSAAVAVPRGGVLLGAIAHLLVDKDAPRLTVLVGHDTNIANMGGLLRMEWAVSGYPLNTTPPGCMLVFSLVESRPGERYVRVAFMAESLEALRSATPVAQGTERMEISVPQCRKPCRAEEFYTLVSRLAPTPLVEAGQAAVRSRF